MGDPHYLHMSGPSGPKEVFDIKLELQKWSLVLVLDALVDKNIGSRTCLNQLHSREGKTPLR